MDNIKNLMILSLKNPTDTEHYLSEAYKLLNGIISKRNINEYFDQATEICVVLSESCLKNGMKDMANNCLKLYFSLDPQESSMLGLAYLIQAQLMKPERFDNETALDKPIGFVLKAIMMSKKDKRFYHLIYDSSLVYYEIVRNYFRRNYYQYLSKSLSEICKALEEVNDQNMEWRAQLMLLLLQSHIDAGHKKEIAQILDSNAAFITKHAPCLLKDFLTIIIINGIGTTEKYQWYTRNSVSMQIFVRLCKLKMMKKTDDSCLVEGKKLLFVLTGKEEDLSNESIDVINKQSDLSLVPPNSKSLSIEQRCSLLLELAKIALQKSMFDVCRQSINKIIQISTEEIQPIQQEAEFINSELTVMEMDASNDKITPTSFKLRLAIMEKCCATLKNVIRPENNRLVEFGCATLWNISLSILQPSLNPKVLEHLVLIADTLESIGSLNYLLCTQVHIEVGKGYAVLERTNEAIKYFKRALLLDRTGEYCELIESFIHKLQMQETIYEKLTDPCKLATQMVEQIKTTIKNTKLPLAKLRPLLIQIGQCLAPDDFQILLDNDLSIEESGISNKDIHRRAVRVVAWENANMRLTSYLKRSGNDEDKTKLGLWVDLVKLSRKLQLWDICRVASCFLILYDDGRWKNQFQTKPENVSRKGNRNVGLSPSIQISENNSLSLDSMAGDFGDADHKRRKREESECSQSLVRNKSRYEKMLLEKIVEVYFIRAEAFVQIIRSEGGQLFTFPDRPKDLKKHPKGFVKDSVQEDEDWKKYCESLQRLTNQVVNCFLRAAALSVELQASWITQNAATYLWNYSMHILELSEHGILVPSFQIIYEHMVQMINTKMVDVIVNFGIVLVHGLIQKSMPVTPFTLDNIFNLETELDTGDKKNVKKNKEVPKGKTSGPGTGGQSNTDSVSYKKAMEISQFLMDISSDPPTSSLDSSQQNQSAPKNAQIYREIDIETKSRLIEIWVQCKQLLHQSIGRSLGADDSETKIGQRPFVRVITAVQMTWINQNEIFKFPDLPTVDDCLQMIDGCHWKQSSLLLSLLIKLCQVTMNGTSPNVVNTIGKIADRALQVCPDIPVSVINALKKENSSISKKKELLSIAYIVFCHGISTIQRKSAENTFVELNCLKLLTKACCYARDADNYYMVSQISHYFWIIAQSLIKRFSGTGKICAEIEIVLNCLSITVNRRRMKLLFEPHIEEEGPKIEAELEEKLPHNVQLSDDEKLITVDQSKSLFLTCYRRQMSKSDLEQDLKLRVQMSVAVYQSYFSRENMTQALKILDDAIGDLPRSHHRLELFRHRLFAKVRLGQSIELDIQKFKNEKESEISLLWREIALKSSTRTAQLYAYKKAIETLKLKENDFLKVDIIMELSQWMFHCDYPVDKCNQFVDYAIDILLNMDKVEEKAISVLSSTKTKPRSSSSKKASSLIKSGTRKDSFQAINEKIDDSCPQPEDNIKSQENWAGLEMKDTVIAVSLASHRPLVVESITDIRLLSKLMVSLVFQAQLMVNVSNKYDDIIIMAYGCVMQMWQVSMSSVSAAVKEIGKTKMEPELSAKSKDKKDKNVKVDNEPFKSKIPKRKGPIDWLPSTYEEWALFEVSDEVLEALKSPMWMAKTGFNKENLTNMGQFMNSLNGLINLLEDIDYEFLSFPILSLMDAISRFEDNGQAKSLNQYIHLRCFQFSIRFNLSSAISHHEKYIDLPFVLPENISDMEIVSCFVKEYSKHNGSTTLPMNFESQPLLTLEVPHLSRKQTKFGYLHETWINMASVFIKLGYNKEASEVIFAAEKLAEVLKDNEKISEIQLLKASLLINQGELDDALQYLDNLENNTHFTLKQWHKFVDLLIAIGVHLSYDPQNLTKMILRLSRLKDHTKKRMGEIKLSNQKFIMDNLIAKTIYGLFRLEERKLFSEIGDKLCWENSFETIQTFLEQLDDIESYYMKSGNYKCAMEIIRNKIHLFEVLINTAPNDQRKSCILSKLLNIERLLALQRLRYDMVHRVYSPSQESSFSLPTDRTLARVKLVLVDCLLDIYSMEVTNNVKLYLDHQNKDPLKQIVDEYVGNILQDDKTPEWRYTRNGICDRICAILGDIHNLCSSVPEINAQCLLKYGKVMQLRAKEIYPDADYQWMKDCALLKGSESSNPLTLETENEIGNKGKEMSVEKHGRIMKIAKRKKCMEQSREFLQQSIELLNQAISLSIDKQLYDICCYATEILVDILGQFDSQLSVQLLCLHQSCRASMSLRQVLLSTLSRASSGQLASLVIQHNYLVDQTKLYEQNLLESPLYHSIIERLNSNFLAWKLTNVSVNQTDQLKDLSNIGGEFCVLEHSLDHRYLYCAFVDAKLKSSNVSKAAAKPCSAEKTRICRIGSSPQQTKELKSQWEQFGKDLDNVVHFLDNIKQRFEHEKGLCSQTENEGEKATIIENEELLKDEMKSNISTMEKRYLELMGNLQEYLNPILENSVKTSSTDMERGESSNQKLHKESTLQTKETMVLLVDEILGITPLELIPQLKHSISRDLSLQTIHYRLKGFGVQESESDPNQSSDVQKKSDKSKLPNRIPALRESGKKTTKNPALNRQLPATAIPVDTHEIRYIVDPYSDNTSLGAMFKKEMGAQKTTRETQITPRWIGLVGQDNHPSICDIELYLKDATALFYVNTDDLATILSPEKTLMMNTAELQLLCCFDRVVNKKAKQRNQQRSMVSGKVNGNSPFLNAQLLTLMGGRSIVFNQWSNLVDWSVQQMTHFMTKFLDDGLCVGETIQSLKRVDQDTKCKDGEYKPEGRGPLPAFVCSNPILYGLPNLMLS